MKIKQKTHTHVLRLRPRREFDTGTWDKQTWQDRNIGRNTKRWTWLQVGRKYRDRTTNNLTRQDRERRQPWKQNTKRLDRRGGKNTQKHDGKSKTFNKHLNSYQNWKHRGPTKVLGIVLLKN